MIALFAALVLLRTIPPVPAGTLPIAQRVDVYGAANFPLLRRFPQERLELFRGAGVSRLSRVHPLRLHLEISFPSRHPFSIR